AVNHDMAFPAVRVLGVVAAAMLAARGRVHRLAVDAGRRPRRIRLLGGPHFAAEEVVNVFKKAVAFPGVEVAPNGALGRKVTGQGPPLTPGAKDVENGVENGSQVGCSWPASRRGRHMRFD